MASNQGHYVDFIKELYQMEIEDEHRAIMQRTVSFNFSAADACMLAAIAKRFGQSTAAFGGELYAGSVPQLFVALTPEDRRQLSIDADAEFTRYAESKGITITPDGQASRRWQSYADICDRVDAEQEVK